MTGLRLSAELQAILDLVAAHRTGVGVEALHEALQRALSRRTLQRRLAALIEQGRLVSEGAGRASKYRLPVTRIAASSVLEPVVQRATTENYVPISAEGEEIRNYVRLPLHRRRPVGYDMSLLEAYQPNHTAYLPKELRTQLLTLGRSSINDAAPAGTFARAILSRLLIDLSWASSKLEGNTYSRLDTEALLEFGQVAEGKDALETQMILNHKAAIEYMVGDAGIQVDAATVIALHALLSDGLLRDSMAGGRVRQRAVEISGSVYRPVALPHRLKELFGIVLRMAAEIDDPFEQAFFLMVHLPYLQPFEDVNKRVSRVAANIPVIRQNLSPLSFIDVPAQAYIDGTLGVYELGWTELLRDVFIWAYERSCQQYVAVQQQLMPPDIFRLRYRLELGQAIKTIVQQDLPLDEDSIAAVLPRSLPDAEQERFAALIRAEFSTLHDGNAVRFGLRPLEFASWKLAHPAHPST
ncbi:MAG: Fic family protein [Variovorax sp.]